MPRFDYYAGAQGAKYLLDVQSDHLYQLPIRVVVPIGQPGAPLPAVRDLTPTLVVEGQRLVMLTPLIVAIPRSRLRKPLGNLLDQSDEITRALGILLNGF